jgi:hypothetical protein
MIFVVKTLRYATERGVNLAYCGVNTPFFAAFVNTVKTIHNLEKNEPLVIFPTSCR